MLQCSSACLVAQLVKNSPAMWETWVGKVPGEGKGYPLQYSGLENSLDCYRPWGRKESDTTEQRSLSGNFTSLKALLCADVLNAPVFSMWSGNKLSRLFQKWIRRGASLLAQMVKNLPAVWATGVWFLSREDPPEKGMATHSSILA